MNKIGLMLAAAFILSGCLSDEKAFGNAVGYGRSYHSPVEVNIPANAPSITQQFRLIEDNEHYGLDVFAKIGTPVIAAAGGEVVRSFWSPPYGNQIVIQHPADASGNASRTRYIHLDERIAHKGERVARGEQIGTLGNTGVLAGGFPHLHFEVLYHGDSIKRNATDPNLFWVNGDGNVTCYGPEHDTIGPEVFVLTYPVVCR